VRIQYEYYAGNDRIRSVSESGGGLFNRTRWEYFPAGDVQRIILDDETGNEIITQFHYDHARRLIQVDSRVSGGPLYTADQWTRYTFDAAGNVTGEELWSRDTGNNRLLIQRVFDAYDRIDTITRGGVAEDLDYNPDGTLAARTDGNLNTTRYSYDAFQRLTSTERIRPRPSLTTARSASSSRRSVTPESDGISGVAPR
jgi:YD repeat-containing protein